MLTSEQFVDLKAAWEELWELGHKTGRVEDGRRQQLYELVGELESEATEGQVEFIDHFCECLSNGCSPKLAEMYASRQGPGLLTDTMFMSERWDGGVEPKMRSQYKRFAAMHGVHAEGKQYIGQLARFPGDPQAWVDSVSDIEKRCKERGWGVDGACHVQPTNIGRIPAPESKRRPLKQRLFEAGLPVAGD